MVYLDVKNGVTCGGVGGVIKIYTIAGIILAIFFAEKIDVVDKVILPQSCL